jgi:hypothetical protein
VASAVEIIGATTKAKATKAMHATIFFTKSPLKKMIVSKTIINSNDINVNKGEKG